MNQEPSDFTGSQYKSDDTDGSYDSSGDQKQIISQLHNKVSDLLHIKYRNKNLEKKQDVYKQYCDKLRKYKQLNQQLQNKLQNILNVFQIPKDVDENTMQKLIDIIVLKINTIDWIQNQLAISHDEFDQETSREISNEILSLQSINDLNTRFLVNLSAILGISPEESTNSTSSSLNDFVHKQIVSAIQNIKYSNDEFKELAETYLSQQKEIAAELHFPINSVLSPSSVHFQIKEAIRQIQNNIQKDISEFASILAPHSDKIIDTPELVKSAISSLQNTLSVSQNELKETKEQLNEKGAQLTNVQRKNESLMKKLNCSTIEEAVENMNELMELMNASNPDILRSSIRQMKDKNKELYSQIGTLNSKNQLLQIDNQTLNEQLSQARDQLNDYKNKFNSSTSKKKSLKTELNDAKSKLNAIKKDLLQASNEINDLKGQITDKEDEILTLRALLQTEKGNIKVHFDEMNNQVLTLKTKLRKVEQDNNSLKSDYESCQIANKSLEEQKESLKDDKSNLQKEIDQNMEKIRALNKEITEKTDELDNINITVNSLKQVNETNNNRIDELEKERIQLKHEIGDINNKSILDQQQISQYKMQIEQKVTENTFLRQNNDKKQLQITELEGQLFHLNNEIQTLKGNNADLIDKNDAQEKVISKNQSKISELEESFTAIKKENNEKQKEITQLSLQFNELTCEVNRLAENNQELEQTLQEKQNQISNQQSMISSMDQNIKQQKQEINNLNSKINDQISQIDNLNQQNETLSQTIFENQDQILIHKNKISNQEQIIKQQKQTISEKVNQLNALGDNISDKENEIQQLTEKLTSFENKNDVLQKNIQQHKSKINEFEQSIKSLNQNIDNLNARIEEYQTEKQIFESNINLLQSENESQRKLNIEIQQTNSNLQRENQKQVFEMQQKINQYDNMIELNKQENESLKHTNEQLMSKLSESNSNNEELINVKNKMQSELSKLSLINQNILTKLKIENIEEIDQKLTELMSENDQNQQKTEMFIENNQKLCKLLEIEPNSNPQEISNVIISQKQELNSYKQQFESIASDLNLKPNEIRKGITDLTAKLTKFESENQSLNNELNVIKSNNHNLQQLFNANDQQSLFEAISNNLNIINRITSILNVSDNSIVEYVQTLQEKLTFGESGGLIDAVSRFTNFIQEICSKLNIEKPEQMISALDTLINEKEEYLTNLHNIKSILNTNSFDGIINELNELLNKISFYHSVEDKLCELYGISQSNELYTQIAEIVNTGKNNMNKYKQQINVLRKQNDKINLSKDDLANKLNEIHNINAELNKNLEQAIQNNQLLTKTLNSQKEKIQELNKMNDDLTHRNNSIENYSQKQLFEISRQLKIQSNNNQDAIIQEIESLQKSKIELTNFQNQIQNMLRAHNSTEVINEIESTNQLISDLCGLFKVTSKDSLVETAQKQIELINQVSPLSKCFKNQEECTNTKWQKIVKEAQTMKQTNEKIGFLLNTKDPIEMINTIKNLQNQLNCFQIKIGSYEEYQSRICDLLNLQHNNDAYKEIQQLPENETLIKELAELFKCDTRSLFEYAKMQCSIFHNIAKRFGINEQSSQLLTIEKIVHQMKEDNDSYQKKSNEYRDFIKKYIDLPYNETDDIVKTVLIELNTQNSSLKEQCNSLQIAKQDNEQLVEELNEKLHQSTIKLNKIFSKFTLNSFTDNEIDNLLGQIDDLISLQLQHKDLIKTNKELTEKTKTIETTIIKNARLLSQQNIGTVNDANQTIKSIATQISRLRQLLNESNSPFSTIVNRIIKMNELLVNEQSTAAQLSKEIDINNERIIEYEKNEQEFGQLIQIQETKIDSLVNELEQNQIQIHHLNNSLLDIYKALDCTKIKSTDFAIHAIEDLKKQILQYEQEISEIKTATTIDELFQKMLENEKKTIKEIKQKLLDQSQYFNSVISKLITQLQCQNQNQEEIRRILSDAEADNYRLLDLLDPPLKNLHIGNEFAMNPFSGQNCDIFKKKIPNENTPENGLYDTKGINPKIRASQKELANKLKKIEGIERKSSIVEKSHHPTSSMINSSLRKRKESTTLF